MDKQKYYLRLNSNDEYKVEVEHIERCGMKMLVEDTGIFPLGFFGGEKVKVTVLEILDEAGEVVAFRKLPEQLAIVVDDNVNLSVVFSLIADRCIAHDCGQ